MFVYSYKSPIVCIKNKQNKFNLYQIHIFNDVQYTYNTIKNELPVNDDIVYVISLSLPPNKKYTPFMRVIIEQINGV
jgi:hypothetical protein